MQRLLELIPGCQAHASGSLWLPDIATLVVADAHLGYCWAQRRRGELGPAADGYTQKKLLETVEELPVETVVFLGDVVHAPRPAPQERALIEATLQQLGAKARLVFVRGNHDRGFRRDFPALEAAWLESWQWENLVALHGDRPAGADQEVVHLLGHLHPVYGLRDDAGVKQRIPIFLVYPRAIVLPAFSPFAAGFDVRRGIPEEIRRLTGEAIPGLIAATGTRVLRLGALDRLRAV